MPGPASTCPAGLYYTCRKPEHNLLVFGSQFGTLGTGTDKGHISLQNINNLRQFVEVDAAQDLAHRGDSVVILPGHAVLRLCIGYVHTAEFIHLEYFSVLCQAILEEEYRAAIANFDANGNDQNNGACQNQEQKGEYDVKSSFYELLVSGKPGITEHQ